MYKSVFNGGADAKYYNIHHEKILQTYQHFETNIQNKDLQNKDLQNELHAAIYILSFNFDYIGNYFKALKLDVKTDLHDLTSLLELLTTAASDNMDTAADVDENEQIEKYIQVFKEHLLNKKDSIDDQDFQAKIKRNKKTHDNKMRTLKKSYLNSACKYFKINADQKKMLTQIPVEENSELQSLPDDKKQILQHILLATTEDDYHDISMIFNTWLQESMNVTQSSKEVDELNEIDDIVLDIANIFKELSLASDDCDSITNPFINPFVISIPLRYATDPTNPRGGGSTNPQKMVIDSKKLFKDKRVRNVYKGSIDRRLYVKSKGEYVLYKEFKKQLSEKKTGGGKPKTSDTLSLGLGSKPKTSDTLSLYSRVYNKYIK